MSDDERMDRAKRIRQLRERRRGADRSGSDRDSSSTADPDGDVEKDTPTASESAGAGTEDASESAVETESTAAISAVTASTGSARSTPEEAPAGADGAEPPNPADGTPTTTAAGTDSAQTADTSSTEGSAIGDDDALAAVAAAARAASEFEGDARPASQTEDNSPDPSSGTTAADSPESEGREEATRDTRADRTRVLAFRVGEERYCLDIEYVEEIVREETVTRVPNTPEYVEGVVDLRGQITTILDPKTTIGIEDSAEEQLIIVFDAETFDDHGYIGWLVDEVDQVMPITHSDVKDAPVQESYINGVIEDDGEFVIWTTPELALDVDEE